ncbi:MAG: hypothetical protein QOH46_805, partial [Solirubrobacteraceae bacterium]|nr:hypothetical protein [Solirubrobacteraceae bacterium]
SPCRSAHRSHLQVAADPPDGLGVSGAHTHFGNSAEEESGETRTRTGDTTIFSRVLYQLSYLAVMGRGG